MVIVKLGKSGFFSMLLACSLLLAGCGQDAPAEDPAEKEAGLATVEAMSREHAEDTTEPSPAAEIAPAREVISDANMAYAEVGDQNVYGYWSAPADAFEPLPAVIMIHEWWGLNDNVRAMADRLAGEGYMVLAVDLYGGQTADTPAAARQLMLEVVEEPELAKDNIRGAYQFLEAIGAPKIGSLGWCFGGGWSLGAAQLYPDDLDASVIFYGQVTDDDERLSPVNVPILGLFAENDAGIKVSTAIAFGDALKRLDKDHEIHIYPDVGHAFANPTGRNYNAEAAEDAWSRTLEFLNNHLSSDES